MNSAVLCANLKIENTLRENKRLLGVQFLTPFLYESLVNESETFLIDRLKTQKASPTITSQLITIKF